MTKLLAVQHDGIVDTALDLPVLAADALADSGILEAIFGGLSDLVVAIPARVVSWLGPELRTPDNSPAPRFIPAEQGPWNGVVFIEGDQPSYWVLARASASRVEQQRQRPVPPFADTRPPGAWPHDPREPSYSSWPYDDYPHDPDRPWEHPPWDPRR